MEYLPHTFLWSVGSIFIVIGAINLLRKQKNSWGFLIAGLVVYLLSFLIMPLLS